MLLFEARHQLQERIDICDFKEQIPEYIEALEIAVKCIDKQQELVDCLNDWDIETEIKNGDRYSAQLCHDIVRQFSIYNEDEEDED